MKALLSEGETCLKEDNQEKLMQMVRYVRRLRENTENKELKEICTNILSYAILIERP